MILGGMKWCVWIKLEVKMKRELWKEIMNEIKKSETAGDDSDGKDRW